MQEKLKSLFKNIQFTNVCGVIAIVFSVIQMIMCIISENYFLSFEMCVASATIFCVLFATAKEPQSANLPIAAALMLYLLRFAERFFTYLTYPSVSTSRLAAIWIMPAILAIMMIIHLAMHITTKRDKLIATQQILYILVITFGIIVRVNSALKATGAFDQASYIISGIALIFTFLTLCSSEVRQ